MLAPVNDSDLLRYSRHILLDDIGIEGQERIAASHVLDAEVIRANSHLSSKQNATLH